MDDDGDGLFGLGSDPATARVVVIPVPWEPTLEKRGAARAPGNVFAASQRVEPFDVDLDGVFDAGIAAELVRREFVTLNEKACDAASPVISAGGPGDERRLHQAVSKVDLASERMNEVLSERTFDVHERGKIPGILGGDASVQFGAIREAVRRFPDLGVLQIAADPGLAVHPLGFTWSHRSVMENVLTWAGLKGPLVQVGVRGFSKVAWERMNREARIHAFPWHELAWAGSCGASWEALARPVAALLPERVWISVDVAALDPASCPTAAGATPGGLSYDQVVHLLRLVREGGRRVVGFDLVGIGDGAFDATVAAHLLLRLAGTALKTNA